MVWLLDKRGKRSQESRRIKRNFPEACNLSASIELYSSIIYPKTITMLHVKSPVKWIGSLVVASLFLAPTVSAQHAKLTDPEIASVAVTANQIDVNYGKIALKKSHNADIRKFAETMVRDHEGVIKQAVALANKLHVTPLTNATTKSLLQGEKKTTKMLNSKSGRAFDKAYADNEAAYHDAVISAIKTTLIPDCQNAELKNLLTSVMPVLEHHLHMAKEMAAKFK